MQLVFDRDKQCQAESLSRNLETLRRWCERENPWTGTHKNDTTSIYPKGGVELESHTQGMITGGTRKV